MNTELIDAMNKEMITLRAQLKEVEGENDQLHDRISTHKNTIDAQSATIERLTAELTQARAALAEMTEKARKYRVALFKTGCNDIFCAEFERDCGKCQTTALEVVKE